MAYKWIRDINIIFKCPVCEKEHSITVEDIMIAGPDEGPQYCSCENEPECYVKHINGLNGGLSEYGKEAVC